MTTIRDFFGFMGHLVVVLLMALAFMVLLTPVGIAACLFAIWRFFGGPAPKNWTWFRYWR